MSVAEEIREVQKKALGAMSTREKLAYFWEYYKIHTLAAVIIFAMVFGLVKQLITSKDMGFYAVLINAVTTDSSSELNKIWSDEFMEYAQIDPGEYEVSIDTSISISENVDMQYSMVNRQKLLAMLMAGSINAFIADTETFETYAQNDSFYDIESLMSQEELNKYGPYLYYTDASTFVNTGDIDFDDISVQEDPGNLTINHRDSSAMQQPTAIGIILTEDNKIADAGYYAYLKEGGYEYQGYPSDVVLGIPLACEEPELVIRFLEYIFK